MDWITQMKSHWPHKISANINGEKSKNRTEAKTTQYRRNTEQKERAK